MLRTVVLLGVAGLLTAGVGTMPAAAAPSTIYYIDCSAHARGTGSAAEPWNRLADIDAHGPFSPGDHILLRRGTTCHGRLAPAGDGTARAPIVIGAWGRGSQKPTVSGDGTTSWLGAVQLTDQEHWTVQDLHVTNTSGGRSTPHYRSGVLLLNQSGTRLDGITVQRLTIDHVTSNMANITGGPRSFGGISALTIGTAGGFDSLTIRDNLVSRVGRTGIVTGNNAYPAGSDTGVRISGNRVRWTRGDGIVMLGAVDGRIDHNVSAHAADEWPCAECGPISRFTANAAIWTGASRRARIDHNEAYGTTWLGGDGEGFDVDTGAVDTVVEYNYAHGNEGGGILFCGSRNAIARFNVFQNNRKSAFAFIGTAPATRTSIYNNTVYQSKRSKGGTVRYFNGPRGSGIRFFNNLVYNHGSGRFRWPTRVWSRSNTYVGLHRRGEPHGGAWSHHDPGLRRPGSGRIGLRSLSGYRPAGTSTMPRGVPIPRSVGTDFFGRRLDPSSPPRGAAG